MVSGKARKGVVRSNESWTDTLLDRADLAITTDTHMIWRAGTMSTPTSPRGTPLANSLRKSQELQVCTPTQAEVDAYVNSLEHEVAAEAAGQERMREIENAKERESTKVLQSKPSTFWCWVVAAIIGCIYWALRS